MSIEADFRALLAGHAALTALVATRIAQSAVPDGAGTPCVVFDAQHTYLDSSDAVRLADRASITVQCWADTAAAAAAVADAVVGAVDTAPANAAARLVDRATTYDPDMGTDGVVLTFDWWA